ncbi:MAG TPA: hypothetical protein VFW31_14825 [Candidatus Angelobacter sp.]|nr:hypothetical protein [Candidatus Angelobacter sp.]
MADADSISTPKESSSPQKNHAHVYDLLYQLNEAFVRVQRRIALLEQIGIFDPLMMQLLNRQSEAVRAGANTHLLGAMRRIEERDRERFSQPPNELNP